MNFSISQINSSKNSSQLHQGELENLDEMDPFSESLHPNSVPKKEP